MERVQVVTLRVEYESEECDEPAAWDWSALVGSAVELVNAGRPIEEGDTHGQA